MPGMAVVLVLYEYSQYQVNYQVCLDKLNEYYQVHIVCFQRNARNLSPSFFSLVTALSNLLTALQQCTW